VFARARAGERFVRVEGAQGAQAARLLCGSPACP